jgi:hypothetical protein
MAFISICIVDSTATLDINVITYTSSDFDLKTLINTCIEIGKDRVLKPIEGTELQNQLFAYIRGLHKTALLESNEENTDTPSSSRSKLSLRGNKTFSSIMKPVLLFVRYRTKGTKDDITQELITILSIEAYIRSKRFPGNVLSQQLMAMPKVAYRMKTLRGTKLDTMEHEFDEVVREAFNNSR